MILLDTHIWVRWLEPADPLPRTLVVRIEEGDRVGVSAISCWDRKVKGPQRFVAKVRV